MFCVLWAPRILKRRNASCLTPWSLMQTVGKRSNITGCHSWVAYLCRNACLEQNKACANSLPFLQGRVSLFAGDFYLVAEVLVPCYANVAFPWLVSTAKAALSVLHYEAPCAVWAQWVGTWMFSYICTSLSHLPNCHSGVILATTYSCLSCLHFLNSVVTLKG